MNFRNLCYLTIILSATSCASNYNLVSPQYVNFQNESSLNEIVFSYRYDVLKERGNKKYSKKETTKNIKLVAVKIINNTTEDFVLGSDKLIYSGNNVVPLLEPEFVFSQLKQATPAYLLFLLLTPLQLNVYNGSTTKTTPIGLFIGPGLTAINVGISATSNAKFKEELNGTFLNNKTIGAGETVTGLIGIAETGYNPLLLK